VGWGARVVVECSADCRQVERACFNLSLPLPGWWRLFTLNFFLLKRLFYLQLSIEQYKKQ
jgi:hypothetical protein